MRARALVAAVLLATGRVAAGEPADHDTTIVSSPRAPAVGRPLRVVAVADPSVVGTLRLLGPDGQELAATADRHGTPPSWWYLEAPPRVPGVHRACLARGTPPTCIDVPVGVSKPPPPGGGLWPVTRQWTRGTEALYAAWIERLFDDPLDAEPSWHALHEVTRRPERNFLYDHMGLGEDDEAGLRLTPDCADLPYFLRAYFAWKLGLPFGWSECSRGENGEPPRCMRWHSNREAGESGGALARMQDFFSRRLAWAVQSGAGRAPADDDRTDFYPTRLAADTLGPGTVYADPYGHTLVVVERVEQTAAAPGLLLAVDAQPDGTVARKRYWRGNFLFALDPTLGSAGFKHFRPIVAESRTLRPLTNREILMHPDWGDYSLEQYQSDVAGFYDRVDDVLSPEPLDARVAFRAAIDALDEQIRTRIRSVANGEDYASTHPGTIPMPEGAEIFETTGAWEDYATPSRDLRLLIAIDVVRGFPAKAARRPQRFATPPAPADGPPVDVRAELETLLQQESATRRFEYVRSDGSRWSLTLADVMARAEALEVAYDPNDCVEVRWGAPAGSDEASTCRRRAPAEQMAHVLRYREWFHDRTRPPR